MEQLTVNDFLGSVDENYRSQLLKNRKKWIPDKLVSYGNLDIDYTLCLFLQCFKCWVWVASFGNTKLYNIFFQGHV